MRLNCASFTPEQGYSSLFSFCTRELSYSESQAQLRIDAMRALRDTPEIEEKVKTGALNVTGLVQVQRFFRKEKQRTGKVYSPVERLSLFQMMEGKTQKEVERELVQISPESVIPQEKMRPISGEKTELKLVISESLRLGLEELKALYSNRMKDSGSTAELLEILVRETLGKKAALQSVPSLGEKSISRSGSTTKTIAAFSKRAESAKDPSQISKACESTKPDQLVPHLSIQVESKSDETVSPLSIQVNLKQSQPKQRPIQKLTRYTPAKIKREVFKRDHGQCTYQDPKTGRVCGSKHYLQVDHVVPYSLLGSSTDPENLRLLCGSHNRYAWTC